MNNILRSNSDYGFFAILLAAFFWGTTGTVAALAPKLSPLVIGAASMGGGGLLQALIARKNIINQISNIKLNKKLFIVGAIGVFIYPLAFYSSMHLAGITVGTVISIGTSPLFTALLEKFFDKKKLSFTWFISSIIGVIGIILLTLGESSSSIKSEAINSQKQILGIFLSLVAGFTYALYSWIAKKIIDKGVDSKASMGLIFGLASCLLIPTLFFTGSNLFDEKINFYVLGYLTIVPMFLGYMLFGFGLKTVPASKAITLTLFEPLVAVILAILLVGEKLASIGWVGMTLIFLCLILLSKKPKPFDLT